MARENPRCGPPETLIVDMRSILKRGASVYRNNVNRTTLQFRQKHLKNVVKIVKLVVKKRYRCIKYLNVSTRETCFSFEGLPLVLWGEKRRNDNLACRRCRCRGAFEPPTDRGPCDARSGTPGFYYRVSVRLSTFGIFHSSRPFTKHIRSPRVHAHVCTAFSGLVGRGWHRVESAVVRSGWRPLSRSTTVVARSAMASELQQVSPIITVTRARQLPSYEL